MVLEFASSDTIVGQILLESGPSLVITIGYWQLAVLAGSFIATAGTVLFGVWISNRDLRRTVNFLSATVSKLDETVDNLKLEQAANAGIERRVRRLEDHCWGDSE